MLKKQYKLFLAVFVLLACIGAYWAKNNYYSYNTESLSARQFTVVTQENDASSAANDTAASSAANDTAAATAETETVTPTVIPMEFSFSNGDAVLDIADGLSADEINVLYFYGDGATVESASASDFAYTDDMSGTIIAVAPEMLMDIDGDGTDETVLACAKSQTTNSQSYAEYAWINHCFGDAGIPVEVAYYGSGTTSTYMDLLVNGAPYTGTIHITSNSGLDTDMEITEGALAGLSIKEIRKGFTVTVTDEEHNCVLVGSYIAEDYPLFGAAALDNFFDLGLMIVLIAAGAAVICFVRRKIGEREIKFAA